MDKSNLLDRLKTRDTTISFKNIADNARVDSGGDRDLNFLKYLIDNGLMEQTEAILKRKNLDRQEEYYLERYKKMNYESDRHFLCRTIIQDELKTLGIETMSDISVGNMDILRSNSNYDIILNDFSAIIDIGLTPARNFYRGLTDLKVKNYLITSYFDDYMDDVIFSVFARTNDQDFIEALKDYQEGFKEYTPSPQEIYGERMYYDQPSDLL